jgi:hypothetical protein
MALCGLGLAFVLLTACSPVAGDEVDESPGTGEEIAAVEAATLPAAAITVVAAIEAAGTATVEPPSTIAIEEPLPPTETPIPEVQPSPTSPVVVEILTQEAISPTAVISPTAEVFTIDPSRVNGIPVEEIAVMPEEVRENVREIYRRGQLLGRNAQAFSKLGDSLIATPSFLVPFDTGLYNLGEYDYLQPAIDYFAGSFERYGVALRPGLHTWGVFDPLWANKEWCSANEDLLACEVRLNNPGVLLILLGTNDAGNPPGFDYNMRKVIEYSLENGIIPVIVTKADRFEGPDNINNEILRQIAADFQVPLWDYDLVAETLPARGLTEDQIHLTVYPENDYTLAEAYQTGHGVHNLTGLMILEAIRATISE